MSETVARLEESSAGLAEQEFPGWKPSLDMCSAATFNGLQLEYPADFLHGFFD